MNAPEKPSSTESLRRWQARMQQVLRHVDSQPEAALDLGGLAALAHSSPFHFHRQFAALCGLPLARYVQLSRMRRAGQWLAHRPAMPVLEVALASGYESPEAFTRAFRRLFDKTPSQWRRDPRSAAWAACERLLHQAEQWPMHHDPFQLDQVRLAQTPDIPVALLVHRGPMQDLAPSLQRFIAWRKERQLPPAKAATYNLLYDDPDSVLPADCRFGLAVAWAQPVPPNPQGLVADRIEGGLHAVLRHEGPDASLDQAIRWLYGVWLPQSGLELRDAPSFLKRLRFFPEVPAHEALVEIHLPLQPA
ncbi:AraC family transcriptional regulator [Roseateles sp. DB2]|uniref:AraC family transcriptional regulator n=1 Tax=Roseateles sp. DB2 TaxID=3453717 RepID=UPI003EEBD0CA